MSEKFNSSEVGGEAPHRGNASLALERMGLIASLASSESAAPNRYAHRTLQSDFIGLNPATTSLRHGPARRVVVGNRQPSVRSYGPNRYAHRTLQRDLVGSTPPPVTANNSRPARRVVLSQ